MSKPFFYRLDAAEFLAEISKFSSDKELGKFIRQFSIDLVTGNGTSGFAKSVISEATEYINKKKMAGSKGGKQKASNAKAPLEQSPSIPLASNSNSNSNNKDNTPYDEIVNLYHEICKSFSKVQVLNDSRKKAIKERWKDSEKNIDTFRILFQKSESSAFMKGQNDNGWKADFDFMMTASKFPRILEGKYGDHKCHMTAKEQYDQDLLKAL